MVQYSANEQVTEDVIMPIIMKAAYGRFKRLPDDVKKSNKVNPDDLVSYAWEAAADGLKNYDPTKGTLDAYVTRCAHNGISDCLRAHDTVSHHMRYRIDAGEDSDDVRRAARFSRPKDSEFIRNTDIRGPSHFDAQITALDIHEALTKLPDRDSHVLEGHYLDGRTKDSIAKEIGVAPSMVSQIHKKALERMRMSLMDKVA